MIFFSAWLSHVPTSRFEQFWQVLRRLLATGGRVLFIDEHVDVRDKEAYVLGRTRSSSGNYWMASSSGS